ncbi:MAG: hemerythrin domain-containing protein [Nitrosomonas sp.]
MPRTGALLPLSREHHSSLVLARNIRKVMEGNDLQVCEKALQAIDEHWHSILSRHFAQEEYLMELMKSSLNPKHVARFHMEHAQLKKMACQRPIDRLQNYLLEFADLLTAHVRFEDRVLFKEMQQHAEIGSIVLPDHFDYEGAPKN